LGVLVGDGDLSIVSLWLLSTRQDSYLDGLERVENVQLCQVEDGVVVDVVRVFQNNKVEPPATAFPASADAPLTAWVVLGYLHARQEEELTDNLKLGAILSEILGLEDALAYSGGLSASQQVGHSGQRGSPT